MYQNPDYQRQVLNTSAAFGIVPRDAQPVDPATVKEFLARLYADSGPTAVRALLPSDFLRSLRARDQRRVRFDVPEDDDAYTGLLSIDDETLFFAFFALFGLLLLSDGFSDTL